ncbi:MAG TPA: diaminopimelate epimerase [Woeseiaceae bacterium]
MLLSFLKMQGTGNDFMIVDARELAIEPLTAEQVRRLADRRRGVGFDQLLWISAARDDGTEAFYRIFNADGSEVEQCGNGARCVAWVIGQDGASDTVFRLGSPAGTIDVQMLDDNLVAVCMGQPQFSPEQIPFVAEAEAPLYDIEVAGTSVTAAVVSMGNPHCVVQVEDVQQAPVNELGPKLEQHPRFPQRSNVGFMAVRDRQNIDLRVFERGVGETLACGTGACAAVVAAQRQQQLDPEVRVTLPGGQVVVSWYGNEAPVWLTGDVQLTYEGTLDL